MQPRTIGGRDGDSRHRLFRRDRWALARVCERQRRHRLGCRYHAAVQNGQRCDGQRRLARRTRPGRRWRPGVREFGICLHRGKAGQRAARVLGGRTLDARYPVCRQRQRRGAEATGSHVPSVPSVSSRRTRMANPEDAPSMVSRRDVLKRVGIAGAAAAVPIDALAQATREPFETLTEMEGATLEAIVARLIPTDATGPGATEARAARYIDRALGGFLASSRDAYRAGLAGIESYARSVKGAPFTQLSAQDQDAVLADMERNAAKGFTGAGFFFNVVL